MQAPKVVFIAGVSGAGKDELLNDLKKRGYTGMRAATTRPARPDDNGRFEYLSKEQFTEAFKRKELLWRKDNHGELYGTYAEDLRAALKEGNSATIVTHDCFPVVADFVLANNFDLEAVSFVYIFSPGRATLTHRLQDRGEKLEAIYRRVEECERWDEEALRIELPIHFIRNERSLPEFFLQAEEHIFNGL